MNSIQKRLSNLEVGNIDFRESIPDRPLTDQEFKELQKHVSLFDILTDCTYPDDYKPSAISKKYFTECERRGIILFQ